MKMRILLYLALNLESRAIRDEMKIYYCLTFVETITFLGDLLLK